MTVRLRGRGHPSQARPTSAPGPLSRRQKAAREGGSGRSIRRQKNYGHGPRTAPDQLL
jgi:hypothetical protein